MPTLIYEIVSRPSTRAKKGRLRSRSLALALLISVTGLSQGLAVPALAAEPPGRIAFQSGVSVAAFPDNSDSQIKMIKPDGTGLRTVRAQFRSLCPEWSPNGRHLAYVEAFSWDLRLIRNVGTTQQRDVLLSATGNVYCSLSWSPANNYIAYRDFADGFVYRVPVRGGARQRILADCTVWDGALDYNPAGTKIAFQGFCGTYTGQVDEIWVANADGRGSDARRLVDAVFGYTVMRDEVEWSPDGNSILAIWGDPEKCYKMELHRIAYPGGAMPTIPLRSAAGRWIFPHSADWSPAGGRITFSGAERIRVQADFCQWDSVKDNEGNFISEGIYVVDAAGRTAPRRLTSGKSAKSSAKHQHGHYYPTWAAIEPAPVTRFATR